MVKKMRAEHQARLEADRKAAQDAADAAQDWLDKLVMSDITSFMGRDEALAKRAKAKKAAAELRIKQRERKRDRARAERAVADAVARLTKIWLVEFYHQEELRIDREKAEAAIQAVRDYEARLLREDKEMAEQAIRLAKAEEEKRGGQAVSYRSGGGEGKVSGAS